jgi:amino acid adenylation domain-containing protein
MSLTDQLVRAALKNESGITFIHADGVEEWCSYKYLYEQALSVLGFLQQQGLQPGNELIIQAEDNKQLLLVFWGCILGKIIPVPLSVGTQSEHKLKVLNIFRYLSNPYWTCDTQQAQRIKTASLAAGRGKEYDAAADRLLPISAVFTYCDEGDVVAVSGNDIAYIQFSSGSTAEPKGVCLTHDNLLYNVSDIIRSLGITDKDTLLSWMPLTHDMGLIGFHLTGLMQNINAVSISTSIFIRRPLIWMDRVTMHEASVLYAPNFGFRYFLSAMNEDQVYNWNLSSVRVIVNGAEPILASLCSSFTTAMARYGLHGRAIVAAYGLAEASVEVSAMPVETEIYCHYLHRDHLNIGSLVQSLAATDCAAVSFVDVGYPVSHCMVRICDNDDKSLPERVVGHIQIKGGNVTSGYYNNPAATTAAFTADRWLRTGDVGFLHAGRLVVTGRFKNIIILNGQNYYPQDIEQLITDAGVTEPGKVVACGHTNKGTNEEELLVFLLHKGTKETLSSIAASVRQVIAGGLGIHASRIIGVKKIPKTTSGKVQYFMLLDQYKRGANIMTDDPDTLPDQENIKDALIRIAATLCGHSGIEEESNLLECGLNSLTAIQFAGRIQQLTGIQVPIGTIFQQLTIQEIIRYIEGAGDNRRQMLKPPVLTGNTFDMSAAQRRMWMECQLQQRSVAYNIPLSFRLSGPLSVKNLELAMKCLIRKYDILRTSFELIDDQLQQRVHAYADHLFSLNIIDRTVIAGRDAGWRDWCEQEAHQIFVLNKPSQFRMSLIKMEEEKYLLSLVIHHMLADGWSLVVLFGELREVYNHLVTNTIPSEELPAIQFREFVSWQQQLLGSGYISEQQQYWQQQIASAPDMVSLAPGAAGNGEQRIETAQYQTSLEGDDWKALQELSRRYETTPFCVLMALLNLVVYRYTQQQDIITGFNSAGRTNPEMERCIGYVLNTLCLRVEIDDEQSFAELAAHVKQKIHAALDHQLYPFEQLLEDSRKDQVYRHSLFSMLVLFQNFYKPDFDLGLHGCRSELEPIKVREGFVDLLLEFIVHEQRLDLAIQYNKAKFTSAFITAFSKRLKMLLQQVFNDDTEKLYSYELLLAEEKELLQQGPAILPLPPCMPVHQRFELQAGLVPDAIAVYAGDISLTYRQLNNRANTIAFLLKDQGIRPDDRVGFLLGRHEGIIIAILAILKAGGAYVPLDAEQPLARQKEIIGDSGMRYLITDKDHIGMLKADIDADLIINMDEPHLCRERAENPVFEGTDRNLAYILYTSGSTGMPKGVMIENRSLSEYVAQFIDYFSVSGNDTFIQQAAVSFDTVIEEIFPALCTSGKIVIAANGGRDIGDLLEKIAVFGVTILSTTPLVLNELNTVIDAGISSLRIVISGGDVLYPSYIDRLLGRVSVYNTYGPTEATVCATYQQIHVPADASLIGRPIRGRRVYILDSHRQLLPVGVPGEIYIEGGLARGYLNLPQQDLERFISSPFQDGERLYRSGDMGMLTESGEIVFRGRNDLQVKVRGYRVEIGEIEKAINKCDRVESAAVIWEKESSLLTAFVTLKEVLPENHIRAYLGDHLPFYMIPARFVVIDKMPLGVNGKLDRNKLPALLQSEKRIAGSGVLPVSKTERQLLELSRKILNAEDLGITDNFFEWGCNSIKAVRMIGEIHKVMQYKLDIRDIFINPSVKLLSGVIGKQVATRYDLIPAAERSENYALSSAQQRLWVLNLIEAYSAAYNEGELFEVLGDLDVEHFRMSFAMIVEKHEMLRTTFRQVNSVPRQVVHDAFSFPLNFLYKDMSGSGQADVEEALKVQMQQPFDLQSRPPYRIILIKQDEKKHLFSIVMHHIITDDWSCKILLREFIAVYGSLKNREIRYVPEPPGVTYNDYVQWSLKLLEDVALQEARKYWVNIFQDGAPVLNIPTDFGRVAENRRGGGRRSATMDRQLLQQLNAYCRSGQISLFMLLTSGLAALLSRYTRQYDLVIGTPVSGRDHPDLDGVMGFFVNMLPIRLQIDPSATLSELVRKVKEACLGAYAHSNYPFERLINEVDIVRDLNRSPIFDVLINLNTIEEYSDNFTLDGALFRRRDRQAIGSKYDLAFYFEEHPDRLSLTIEYDSNLFTETRIEGMIAHYINFINAFATSDARLFEKVDYLKADEQAHILSLSRGPVRDFQDDSIIARISRHAGLRPDRIAVSCAGNTYTFNHIDSESDLLAGHIIRHHGIRPGDKVCLLLDRSALMIIAIMAVWKAGAAYIPIDPSFPESRISYIIENTGAALVLTSSDIRQQSAAAGEKPFYLCGDMIPCNGAGANSVSLPATCGDIAYIMYTSGSTGFPKGVMVPHAGVLNVLNGLEQLLGVTGTDLMLSVSSYTFDISVSEFFLPLINGVQVVLALKEEVKDARLLRTLFEKEQPTLMQGTPALWSTLVACGWNGSSHLRAVTCGEPLSEELRNTLQSRVQQLWNLYGPTETSIFSTGSRITETSGPVSIGYPFFNTDVYILDSNRQLVPEGVYGELYIGGAGVAHGYLDQSVLTAAKFMRNTFSGKGNMYASGDIGRWLSGGVIEYAGRADNQVKLRGFRIELEEIERTIAGFYGILSAAVVLSGGDDENRQLLAFVVCQEGTVLSGQEIRSLLQGRLPSYMIPAAVILLPDMPLTGSGKTDRKMLAEKGLAGREQQEDKTLRLPSSKWEERLLLIWKEILPMENISTIDSFFDLGGHSLLANKLINRIYTESGIEMKITDVFTHPTITQMGKLAAQMEQDTFDYIEL